jgi:hypothetical protein
VVKSAWQVWAVGSLVVLGFGCGSDPVPMTGRAAWREGCLAAGGVNCTPNSHIVSGSNGSPTVDVLCNIVPITGGYSVTFRIAAIEAGQNFSESQEGLFATGLLPSIGAELRTGDDGGFVQVRGSGWSIPPSNGTIGITGACHVFVDRVTGQNFNGRVKCDGLMDDLSPPRQRYIAGTPPSTQTVDYGEFSFTNCTATP